MGAIRKFQKRERENWESYFESSPSQARVVHYAKALCFKAKFKILSAKYSTISQKLEISERTVSRALAKACEIRILGKVSQGFKKRRAFYWLGDVREPRLANDEVRESIGLPSLYSSLPVSQQKSLQKSVYNYSNKSHITMKRESQVSSFSLLRERVLLEYQTLKSELLKEKYSLEDIERFFLKEIESKGSRKALGFLDPERANNDWKSLSESFKKSFQPIRIKRTIKIKFPWENLKEEERITQEELKEIWQDFYRKKGRLLE